MSTNVPRINVLGSLTQFAWIALVLDAFEPSGHILEAEYTRQASIPTIFVRRMNDEHNPCYVVSLYATKLARQGVLKDVTREGGVLNVCNGIILTTDLKDKVKVKGSTGMLRDLTGSIYVTVAFRSDIVEEIKQYLLDDERELEFEVLEDVSRCMECGVKLLLEQYGDKLEFV